MCLCVFFFILVFFFFFGGGWGRGDFILVLGQDYDTRITCNANTTVSRWLSGSSRSPQSFQIMFRRSGRSYGNTTRTIANDPDDWNDRDRVFYPDDWDDRVKFKAIIWKHWSGRSKAVPEIIIRIPWFIALKVFQNGDIDYGIEHFTFYGRSAKISFHLQQIL